MLNNWNRNNITAEYNVKKKMLSIDNCFIVMETNTVTYGGEKLNHA
jgi:hypothetical protein